MKKKTMWNRAAACAASLTLLVGSAAHGQELLGYWNLDETDYDSPAADSSGNGLTGFFEGDVDPDVGGAPGFGSGAYFEGTTSQVFIEGGLDVFGPLTNDFTVMAWINPEQFDRKNRIFGGFPVGGGWGFGTVRDELEITTYGVRDYDQPAELQLNEWVHVAVALDANNNANFYKDGAYLGTQEHGSPGNAIENEFYIGASCCATEFFMGSIDEVGVFQGTLTEQQIFNAMTNGVSGYNDDVAIPPVEVAGRGVVGSEAINGARQNLAYGEPSGDIVTGLGQSWYTGTAGTKAAADEIYSGERVVPYFQGQDGTWWSGANPVLLGIQDYPVETTDVITGDAYSVKLEGEILIEESGVIQFLDGIDDYTYFAIDLDRSGTAGDSAAEVLYDDNNWTNAVSEANGGSPIVQADFQDVAEGGEWFAVELNMSEGGGGDAGIIYWDFNDVDELFPVAQGAGVHPDDAEFLVIPESNLRSRENPAELESGEFAGVLSAPTSGWEIDVDPADGSSDAFALENPDADVFTTVLNVDGVEFHINALGEVSDGDTFQILLADTIMGTPVIATDGWSFVPATGSVVFGSACDPNSMGDLDGNGTVEFADFLVLSANFGTEVSGHSEGDIDCNGTVDFADFLALSANFGSTVAGSQAVPEPMGLSLLASGVLLIGLLRRKRQ